MKYVVLLSFLLGACSGGITVLEYGTGYNASIGNDEHSWEHGGSPAFYGSLRREWKKKGYDVVCQYMHVSQLLTGPPVNDESESSLDHIGCGIRYTFTDVRR